MAENETEMVTEDEQNPDAEMAEDSNDAEEEKARMAAAVKKANHEAAKYRKRVEAYEIAEAERAAAALTELEKAQKAATDAQAERDAMIAQIEKATIKHEVEMTAARLDFIDPSDAYALANLSDVAVEDGNVTGVDEALKKLKKAKPHLVKQAPNPNTDSQKHNTAAEADEATKQRVYSKFGVPQYPS